MVSHASGSCVNISQAVWETSHAYDTLDSMCYNLELLQDYEEGEEACAISNVNKYCFEIRGII